MAKKKKPKFRFILRSFCGKRLYASADDAIAAAKDVELRGMDHPKKGWPIVAYVCGECMGWHWGHQAPRCEEAA